MQKVRIIPTLLYNNSLVKGKNFNSWRVVSDLHTMIKIYNLREVDELIFFDINATANNFINLDLIDQFADECFVPLTIGGGVRNMKQIEKILKVGADKICINSASVEDPKFVTNAINQYGSQCIVISIDYKINSENKKEVFINSGKKKTGIMLDEHLKKMSDLNPCEIILTSIDHDGIMKGYDINTISLMNSISSCPIIASGGAGTCDDIFNVISESNIKAVSSSSIYHFTETTPLDVKRYLNKKGILVRL
jgi:imidazole glycerol-phosphate synthase subunit HisF